MSSYSYNQKIRHFILGIESRLILVAVLLITLLVLNSCYEGAYNPPYIISQTPPEEESFEEKNIEHR